MSELQRRRGGVRAAAHRFPLPPAGIFARLLPLLVGGLMPILAAVAIALQAPAGDFPWVGIALPFLVLPLAGLALAATFQGRMVVIRGETLRVRRWPAPRDFAVGQIDLGSARVATIGSEPALTPMLKLMGTRIPGMRSGWFLTRARRRAYVLSTTAERVAVLPMRDGRLLLLGVERPEALLAALHDAAAARH